MKEKIKRILQKTLGLKNYLFLLGIYKLYAPKNSKYEGDFPYFLSLLNENSVVLDIGAHVGYTIIQIAKKAKEGFVYAFEPIPNNIVAIKRLIKFLNVKNSQLIECALGNFEGNVEIAIPVLDSFQQTNCSHLVIEYEDISSSHITINVPIYKLDSLKELRGKTINAIKIDVEGFENTVFEGGLELLKLNKPIIYSELNGEDNRKLSIDLLSNIGYKTFVFIDNKLISYDSHIHNSVNYFFLPK